MTSPTAIATADDGIFADLRRRLLDAGVAEADLHPTPLRTPAQAVQWLADGDRGLLVLDAALPFDPEMRRDHYTVDAAKKVLYGVQARTPRTPVLVITPTFTAGAALDEECKETGSAVMLPMNLLQELQHRILRPFIAMLTGTFGKDNEGIPGGIRVIETVISSERVECRLGTGGEGAPMLRWNTVPVIEELKKVALEFGREQAVEGGDGGWLGISLPSNWLDQTRSIGEKLFDELVVKVVGTHLFSQIESAAGGLPGLSFRFVINSAEFYPAPFEASVRRMQAEVNGPFVLLHAPLVRQMPSPVQIHKIKAASQIKRGAKVLFVRSQVGEHPDYERVSYGGNIFDKLGNIDSELGYLKTYQDDGRISLEVVDLSKAPPGGAARALFKAVEDVQPEVLHYAGHAWSDGNGSATLILPGATPDTAMGLKVERMAAFGGLLRTKLVYLSACRGISKGSVQHLVMNGIPYALGFRWNVDDERAPLFAKAFYDELWKPESVCLAFRKACRVAYDSLDQEDDSPIWLSPILLAQSADWATRSYVVTV